MNRTQNPERVPNQMRPIFESIVVLTEEVCSTYLDGEYAHLARKVVAALCRKRPSPLLSGTAKAWACGIVHALGHVNFLFDSTQSPHMKAGELFQAFGVSPATGAAKSKVVREALGMSPFGTQWCLPSRLEDNPLLWMLSVNGLPVDIRTMPREVQLIAYEKGLIPYIPADRQEE
jgi:hypothetical protein